LQTAPPHSQARQWRPRQDRRKPSSCCSSTSCPL
jgi:hypothetical protein